MNESNLLQFDYLFHNPNPAIDEYLHGDHTHTDEDGNEVTSPGTPDRPVVIEPEPDPDPPNANPGPAPDADAQPAGDGMIEPLTKAKLDALTQPGGVPTAGVFRGGDGDELIFNGFTGPPDPVPGASSTPELIATYGVNDGDKQLYGGDGNDVLVGGRGVDYLDGGPGNDYLFGDRLLVFDDGTTSAKGGWSGANILMGGPGNDYLHDGAFGVDILNGGPGNDHLVAEDASFAVLIGGPGRDVFDVAQGYRVKIKDFQDSVDKILLVTNEPHHEYVALHQLAARAGVQFDIGWIATEVDDGVTLPIETQADESVLTIEGAYLANLQFELVNGDLFIV